MLLYVLNNNLLPVGVIDSFISLLWYTKIDKSSTFEVYVPATKYYRNLLRGGRFVKRYDSNHIMYITTIEEQHTADGKNLIVRGKGAEALLSKIIYPPDSINKKYESLIELFDDVNISEKLGCYIDYASLGTASAHLRDTPSEYLSDNLEELTRYILGRTNTLEDEETTWYKSIPESYLICYSPPDNIHDYPYLFIYVINIENKDYLPSIPTLALSEDIGNITDTTYKYSEEECYNYIMVRVNQNYTQTFTYDDTDVNISFDDLDVETKIVDGKVTPVLPIYDYSLPGTDPIQRQEKVIYADPVYEEYSYRPPTSGTTYDWYNNYDRRNLRQDTPYSTGTYPSQGRTSRVMVPTTVNEETRRHYRINTERTMVNMITAAKNEALLATENVQGTFRELKRPQSLMLGQISIYRDNIRGIDLYKQLTEIDQVWDENGYTIIPVFGEPLKTLWDLI